MLFIVFIFGLIIGSFLNVVILRYGTGESIFKGKSHCPNCRKDLSWYELIPVLSFIIQKGRCSNCQSKISLQYPTVELLTAVVFVLITLKIFNFQLSLSTFYFLLSTFYYWIIFSFLIIISVYDIHHQIIPNHFVYPLIIISLFAPLFQLQPTTYKLQAFYPYILAGFLLYAFFALLWLVSKGKWMGYGDAKLALAIGFFLGPLKGLIAFLLSFWIGAAFGIAFLILSKGKIGLKSQIPFGPFLALAAFLAFLTEINLYSLTKFFNINIF